MEPSFPLFIFTFILIWPIIYSIASKSIKQKQSKLLKEAELEIDKTRILKEVHKVEQNLSVTIQLLKAKLKVLKSELDLQGNDIIQKLTGFLKNERIVFAFSENFYSSNEWRELRQERLKISEKKCVTCLVRTFLTVDHIKPRSKYPELALELKNTQILCASCNSSKGNKSRRIRR